MAQADDPRARFLRWVTTLVHRERARLLGVARARGLAGEEAVDCVQDAFAAFVQRPDAEPLAQRPEDAGRVLATLVAHAAQNQRRKLEVRARHAAPPEDAAATAAEGPSADELIARAEDRVHLVRCVDRLSRMQQAVVRLRLLDDLPGEEVSQLLGVSAANVRVLLFRARADLRACLELSEQLDAA